MSPPGRATSCRASAKNLAGTLRWRRSARSRIVKRAVINRVMMIRFAGSPGEGRRIHPAQDSRPPLLRRGRTKRSRAAMRQGRVPSCRETGTAHSPRGAGSCAGTTRSCPRTAESRVRRPRRRDPPGHLPLAGRAASATRAGSAGRHHEPPEERATEAGPSPGFPRRGGCPGRRALPGSPWRPVPRSRHPSKIVARLPPCSEDPAGDAQAGACMLPGSRYPGLRKSRSDLLDRLPGGPGIDPLSGPA